MKRALIVGINYVGTGYDLRGCINDANNMKAMLASHGFDITMLLESAATTDNIKGALLGLVHGAQPGDVLVFHYSGHGSQLPSSVEADGYEEIICPYDLDWKTKVITDDYLKSVFNQVPNGVNCTVILDCCNSGDGLDTAVPDVVPVTDTVDNPSGAIVVTNGNGTVTTTTDGDTVTVSYSSKFLPPPHEVANIVKNQEPVIWKASRDLNASSILIAACKSYQTSADAYIAGSYQGAATYALLQNVAKNSKITYRQLIAGMQNFMNDYRFTQTPELDGAEVLKDKVFLEPFPTVDLPPVTTPITPSTVVPSDNNNIAAIVVVVIVVALILFTIL